MICITPVAICHQCCSCFSRYLIRSSFKQHISCSAFFITNSLQDIPAIVSRLLRCRSLLQHFAVRLFLTAMPFSCTALTRYGFIILPLFATALYSISVCSGLTSTSYPKPIHGRRLRSRFLISEFLMIGAVSPTGRYLRADRNRNFFR